MCFLVCQREKSRDVDNKSSSRRTASLSNRTGPKPHPRVHEHTSSQSHCIQEGRFLPALTEATPTSLLMSLERGKTSWPDSRDILPNQALCLAIKELSTLEVLTYIWVYKNCHLTHPHLNCKLQTSHISHRRQELLTSTALTLLRPKPV